MTAAMSCLSFKYAVSLLTLVSLSGCVTQEGAFDQMPVVEKVSAPSSSLRRMPAPQLKTVVAVYGYEDLTGQFKERDNVQSLSRAVTQGGTPMLIKALQDAGERRWFTVLERSQLDNLLKERQILTEMRRLYRNETQLDPNVLPPLLSASIIIEGGIIGYDTNIMTGGAGARFLGIGADAKYLQDVVTVALRAVSIKTGEVLTTVSARKAVASYALQGNAFRYVKLDEILEAEAGVTYNEPKQIAVQSAIEKAVESLIVEGSELGIWNFQDQKAGQTYVDAYRSEKYGSRLTAQADTLPAPKTTGAADITETTPLAAVPVAVASRDALPGVRTGRSSAPAASPSRAKPGQTLPGVPSNAPIQRQLREQVPPPELPPAPSPNEEPVG